MNNNVTIKLTDSIPAYGNDVSEIELQAPTGKDIRECGFPFRIHGETEEMAPQAQIVARYISTLGKIPMGSVDRLSAADFNACMSVVLSFFGDSPGDEEDQGKGENSKTSPATSAPSSASSPQAS